MGLNDQNMSNSFGGTTSKLWNVGTIVRDLSSSVHRTWAQKT